MFIRRLFFAGLFCLALLATQSTQAQIISFELEGMGGSGLLPGNEVGGSTSSGSGDILTEVLYNMGTNELSIDVGWGSGNGFTDLGGPATAMHIHGPADFFSNAGVQYGLNGLPGFDGSATDGGFTGSLTIDADDEGDLLGGLFYINVHTANNASGALRGNLVAVPEPTSAAALGLLGLGLLRRKRTH